MSRAVYITLKWIALATVGLLAVAATAVAALLFWIDPGVFRDDLERLAREQGVALHLRGELDWRIYPQVQIITTDTALGALDAAPLAELDSLAVSVALRPLLRSELQVTGIAVNGLQARFEVNEDGSNNWQKLIQQSDARKTVPPDSGSQPHTDGTAPPPITIDKLRISDGQLHYTNRQTAQTASANNIDIVITNLGQAGTTSTLALKAKLTASDPTQVIGSELAITSPLSFNSHFSAFDLQGADIDIELHYRSGDQEIDSRLQLPLSLSVSLDEAFNINTLAIDDGNITYSDRQGNRIEARNVLLAGQYRPGITDSWQVTGHIGATLAPDSEGQQRSVDTAVEARAKVTFADDISTVNVDDLHAVLFADLNPLRLAGNAKLQFQPLDVQGQLAIADFNPQTLTSALSLPLPKRADPSSLTKASLRSRISLSETLLSLTEIAITLDDTSATGELTVPLGATETRPVQLGLHLDQVDVDRYLAPQDSPESGNKQPASSPATATDWDFSALSSLDMKADLKADRVTVRHLPFTDTELQVDARNGQITLSALQGQLYNSPFHLAGELNTRATPYQFRAQGQATELPLGKVLKDLQLEQRFTGNSDITFQLSSQGNSIPAVQQALNGDIEVTGRELTLSGINIERAFCRLVTAVQKQSFNPTEWVNLTHFADTTTRIHFRDGIARIEQLKAGVSQLAVSAKGKVDLGQSLFDVVFNTRLASRDREQAPCAIDNPKLLDRDIPIRCKASFDGIDLSTCLPDMRVAEDIAKEKLKDKVDDKAKSFLEEKLGEEKSKAAEQLFKQLIKPSRSKTSADDKDVGTDATTTSPADEEAASP